MWEIVGKTVVAFLVLAGVCQVGILFYAVWRVWVKKDPGRVFQDEELKAREARAAGGMDEQA